MLLLGDGTLNEGEDGPDDDLIIGLSKLLFVVFMVGINVFMLNLMINLMDDFMCVQAAARARFLWGHDSCRLTFPPSLGRR